jgi:hypothetical protein
MVEAIRLFAGECQHLLGTRSKVVHHDRRKRVPEGLVSGKLGVLEMECNHGGAQFLRHKNEPGFPFARKVHRKA